MQIHVYDTYVKAKDGHVMHFDVFTSVKDDQKAIEYAKQWLKSIGETEATVTTKECSFCHTQGSSPDILEEIQKNGFYIYKMEGC